MYDIEYVLSPNQVNQSKISNIPSRSTKNRQKPVQPKTRKNPGSSNWRKFNQHQDTPTSVSRSWRIFFQFIF